MGLVESLRNVGKKLSLEFELLYADGTPPEVKNVLREAREPESNSYEKVFIQFKGPIDANVVDRIAEGLAIFIERSEKVPQAAMVDPVNRSLVWRPDDSLYSAIVTNTQNPRDISFVVLGVEGNTFSGKNIDGGVWIAKPAEGKFGNDIVARYINERLRNHLY